MNVSGIRRFKVVFLLMVFFAKGELMMPPFDDYYSCANSVNKFTVDSGCSDVLSSAMCMKKLTDSTNLCQEFPQLKEGYFRCAVMSLASHHPMAGPLAEMLTDTGPYGVCRHQASLFWCHEQECGEKGQKFQRKPVYRPRQISSEDDCSVQAQKLCIDPIVPSKPLTEDYCYKVGKARECFFGSLTSCSGNTENQIAADLLLIGLKGQLEECERHNLIKKGLDAPLCGPEPDKNLIPREKIEEMSLENCNIIHKIGEKLSSYAKECAEETTIYTMDKVQNLLSSFNMARIECYKNGLPPSDKQGLPPSDKQEMNCTLTNDASSLSVHYTTVTAALLGFIFFMASPLYQASEILGYVSSSIHDDN